MSKPYSKFNGTAPLIPLRGMVAFPNGATYIDLRRDRSVAALERAMDSNHKLMLVAQRDATVEEPTQSDLFAIGSVVNVRHIIPLGEEGVRVLCEGEARAMLVSVNPMDRFDEAVFMPLPSDTDGDVRELTGYCELAKSRFTALQRERSPLPGELAHIVDSEIDPDRVADIIGGALRRMDQKQQLLECRNVLKRLQLLCVMLDEEIEMSRIEREIDEKTRGRMEEHQRDYYLHEQLRLVKEELGEDDEKELDKMRLKLKSTPMNDEARDKTNREIERLETMPRGTPEAAICENYIEWMLSMPWDKRTNAKIDMARARKVLDEDHYGLDKVKERILEYLAVCSMRGDMKSPIICLVGPPGVGKTSIATSIARALKRKFVRVSLGGLRDEAEIRGHRRTYIGAQPGRIVSGLRQCGVMDPVFLFDEIDKMASDFRGDPASAMLEALDPAQNATFTDHYLDAPFDLSRVMFITTANNADDIPEPLLDRMELIEVPSYTLEEKIQIARRHLWPRQLKENGLTRSRLGITDKAISELIAGYTREAGVRTLERELGHVCRKAVLQILESGTQSKINVKPESLESYLGVRKFLPDEVGKSPETGVVNGLAWTQVGGTTMPIEVAVMPGQGAIEMTGRLGDVMKESARTALSYIRSRSKEFGLDDEFHRKNDIHIHVPEGAVPKDGPSAGVALTCAMVSAFTGIPARQDVAMTGEITLRGHVLPIGGVKEKLLAAYRLGITTLLLPSGNEKDLTELPTDVREHLDIHLLHQVDEALNLMLVR